MEKRRHTLLVVDDEPDVVRSVHDLLRLEYQVVGATSARIGLDQLQKRESSQKKSLLLILLLPTKNCAIQYPCPSPYFAFGTVVKPVRGSVSLMLVGHRRAD